LIWHIRELLLHILIQIIVGLRRMPPDARQS